MLTTPLAVRAHRYLLKLDPPEHPHLVENEAAHLQGARALKIPVARYSVIRDRNGLRGLLVERFDRVKGPAGTWVRLPLEDGTHYCPAAREPQPLPAIRLCLADRQRGPARQEPRGPGKPARIRDGPSL